MRLTFFVFIFQLADNTDCDLGTEFHTKQHNDGSI